MISKITQKIFSPKITKKEFIENFFKDPNHQWINQDKNLKRAFAMLLNDLKDEHVFYFNQNKTFFIECEGILSCAVGNTQDNFLVLVFPELKEKLKTYQFMHGLAILAHEMGHIYHRHTEKKVQTLEAQVEADEFAFKLGFGEELQEVLLDYNHNIDTKVRISRLTTLLIERKYNQ